MTYLSLAGKAYTLSNTYSSIEIYGLCADTAYTRVFSAYSAFADTCSEGLNIRTVFNTLWYV
jgi:hypothetical protein